MLTCNIAELVEGCIANPIRDNNMADSQSDSRVFAIDASNQCDSSLGICLVLDTQSFADRTVKTRLPKHTEDIGIQVELDH